MASIDPVKAQDAIVAYLEANLDANARFTSADIGTAAEINYIKGIVRDVTPTPAIIVDCGDWNMRGNPQALQGSDDTCVAQVVGLIQFVDREDQDEKIKYFAWAVRQVLENQTYITDASTGRKMFVVVRSLRIRYVAAAAYVEGEAEPEFRAFQLLVDLRIPQNR